MCSVEEVKNSIDLLKDLPLGIFITDEKGIVLAVNELFTSITGYTSDEVVGKKIGKESGIMYSGFHDTTFYEEMWETLLSGKVYSGEIRNRKKSGELYWQQVKVKPYRNKNKEGKPIENFVSIIADASELRQNELKLKTYLENTHDITIVYDKERRVVDIFPDKFFNIYPHLRTRIGQNFFQSPILKKEEIKILNDAMDRLDETEKSQRVFISPHTEKGIIHFECIVRRYNSVSYVIVYRDISEYVDFTEQKKQILDILPEGVIVHTSLGIQYANKSLATMLGYKSMKDLLGRNVLDLIPADLRSAKLARMKKLLLGEQVEPMEFYLLTKKQEKILVELNSIRTKYNDMKSVLTVVRNLDELQRRTEQKYALNSFIKTVELLTASKQK